MMKANLATVFLITCAITAFLCRGTAAASETGEMTAAADTLNILTEEPAQTYSGYQHYGYAGTEARTKVEGTLSYKGGWIYTSDHQPLMPADASMYFSPEKVKIYRRNNKVFSSGRNIVIAGSSIGGAGAVGFLCRDITTADDDILKATAVSIIIAAAVTAPCAVAGVPMMIKGKLRMKRLVREYNSSYIFGK